MGRRASSIFNLFFAGALRAGRLWEDISYCFSLVLGASILSWVKGVMGADRSQIRLTFWLLQLRMRLVRKTFFIINSTSFKDLISEKFITGKPNQLCAVYENSMIAQGSAQQTVQEITGAEESDSELLCGVE